jgi:hypothetical protein
MACKDQVDATGEDNKRAALAVRGAVLPNAKRAGVEGKTARYASLLNTPVSP